MGFLAYSMPPFPFLVTVESHCYSQEIGLASVLKRLIKLSFSVSKQFLLYKHGESPPPALAPEPAGVYCWLCV